MSSSRQQTKKNRREKGKNTIGQAFMPPTFSTTPHTLNRPMSHTNHHSLPPTAPGYIAGTVDSSPSALAPNTQNRPMLHTIHHSLPTTNPGYITGSIDPSSSTLAPNTQNRPMFNTNHHSLPPTAPDYITGTVETSPSTLAPNTHNRLLLNTIHHSLPPTTPSYITGTVEPSPSGLAPRVLVTTEHIPDIEEPANNAELVPDPLDDMPERRMIRPLSDGFVGADDCNKKITNIILSYFKGAWPSWSQVPKVHLDMWFKEFGRGYTWANEDEYRIRKNFGIRGSSILRHRMDQVRKKGVKPHWIGNGSWKELLRYWGGVHFKKQSKRNKKNHGSNPGYIVYPGGNISFTTHREKLAKETGVDPGIAGTFKHLHSTTNDMGETTWKNDRMRDFYNLFIYEFEKEFGQAFGGDGASPEQKQNEGQIWRKVGGDPKKRGGLTGLGNEGILIRRGTSSSASKEQIIKENEKAENYNAMETRLKELEATVVLFMQNIPPQYANNPSQFSAPQLTNQMHPNMLTSSVYHPPPNALTNFQIPHSQQTGQTQPSFGVGFTPVPHQHALPTSNHSSEAYEQSFQRLLALGSNDQRTTIQSLSDNCTTTSSNDEKVSNDDNDDDDLHY